MFDSYEDFESEVYPDTEQGVRDMLKNETEIKVKFISSIEPDPFIRGIWKVNFTKSKQHDYEIGVVTLHGYGNNIGNDIEMFYNF